MIDIARPDALLDRSVLERRGGFAWWYVDIIDADGNGAVIIWSFGLPFLPGYRAAALEGRAPEARELPSLNIVVYRAGKPVFYQLQRYSAQECTYEPERARWTMQSNSMSMREIDGDLEISMQIDSSIPATDARLQGQIEIRGARRHQRDSDVEAAGVSHAWTPIAPHGRGRFSLEAGDDSYQGDGTAYADANVGDAPFCRFGIDRWTWARAAGRTQTRIVYLVDGDVAGKVTYIGAVAHADGRFETFPLRARSAHTRRAAFGLRYLDEVVVDGPAGEFARLRVVGVADDGPFYLRLRIEMEFGGERAAGWGELVCPARIDLARHRALVRMRVDDLTRRPSFWLPLFSGSRTGRVRRLLSQLAGVRRRLTATPQLGVDGAAP